MSGKVYAYIAFSYLNAVTAFLIAWLMHIRITSFAVVAVVNEWDLDEKAAACRNAGLMYLVLAVGLSLRSMYQHYRTRDPERQRYDAELSDMREKMPLLYSSLFEPDGEAHSAGAVSCSGRGYGSSESS
ncbi:hypothetical protein DQ04_01131080 [Trypanosoma grayi]|uniref:hypothetical protein n=1 Tax=Trypanosoma grayi TaxID=71804 RepID=UPI0004F45D2C|nr:hypothetical protein DQ04_01131080 [Trypanosoma grayi]KEG13239.1 hypothetical protein DQ04_01131080 [Trypanosoma grayi]